MHMRFMMVDVKEGAILKGNYLRRILSRIVLAEDLIWVRDEDLLPVKEGLVGYADHE